jgi:hypothetical protein
MGVELERWSAAESMLGLLLKNGDTEVAGRLGNVLFGLGIIIAPGLLAISCFAITTITNWEYIDRGALIFMALAVPVPSLLIGWALLYILRG